MQIVHLKVGNLPTDVRERPKIQWHRLLVHRRESGRVSFRYPNFAKICAAEPSFPFNPLPSHQVLLGCLGTMRCGVETNSVSK